MPDVHGGCIEWLAGLRIDKRDPQLKRYAGLSLGHVAACFAEIDVVGALLLFRCQRASGCGGKNARRRGDDCRASNHESAPIELQIHVLHGSKNRGLLRQRL
jgi:hypothetical protein